MKFVCAKLALSFDENVVGCDEVSVVFAEVSLKRVEVTLDLC